MKSLIPSGSNSSIPGLNLETPIEDPLSQSTKSIYNSVADITTSQYDYPEEPVQTPLQPPPMPPNLFPLDDTTYKYEQTIEREEDAWNTKLPPKFPTWGDTSSGWEREETEKTSEWTPVLPPNKVIPIPPMPPPVSLDTPESPPMYEKEGFSDPVEYDDSVVEPSMMSSTGDVDHRTLIHLPQINHTKDSDCRIPPPVKHMQDTDHRVILPVTSVTPSNHSKKDMDHRQLSSRKKDVDHRNLISLTGSPVRDHSVLPPPPTPPSLSWSRSDQDYRTPVTPSLPIKKEIHQGDQDYRLHPPHHGRRQFDETQDNVESVDMEMSDEEGMDELPLDNMHDKKHMMDKNREYDSGNKPVISFNINSNTKLLANSPLNEVKEDMSQTRNRVYGCQKIPTISGIGGTMHSPRGMGPPRPRIPVLTPPPVIKRHPPPGLPRGFRPSLMSTPPPLPPYPPPVIQQQERCNVTIEIKPQEEIESQIKIEKTEKFVTEKVVTDSQTMPPLPPLPPSIPTNVTVKKEIIEANEINDLNSIPIPINNTSSDKIENSIENSKITEKESAMEEEEESEKKDNKKETKGEEVDTKEEAEALDPVQIPQMVEKQHKPMNMIFSEHWMNNELAELEQMENMSREQEHRENMGRGQGRGRPFKNFPRGGFVPRTRPMWNGPRRGVLRPPPPPPPPPPLPPGRFPFRPPLERPFGRGLRGGFRPFRGNRGHRGW